MPPELPALRRLIDDVSAAMHAAEQTPRKRRWRRGWPLAIALLMLAVPSAAALHAVVTDHTVDVPPAIERGTMPGSDPAAGRAVALAQGTMRGHGYTLVGQRCEHNGVASIAISFSLGHNPRFDGGAYNTCLARRRSPPLVAMTRVSSPGQTWIAGITRAQITSVQLHLVRRGQRGRPTGNVQSTQTRLQTRPLDPVAVGQGNLPTGYRSFVLFRPHRAELTRLIARDHENRIVLSCAAPVCDRLAR